MNLEHAQELARALMDAHGLSEWSFAFDRAKRRAGATHFQRQQITLSRAITQAGDVEIVRDTILHEIAHALVGRNHGHDKHWQQTCRDIGGSGQTRLTNAPEIPGNWLGICPAGHEIQRHRRPPRPLSCAVCHPRKYSARHQFVWYRRQQ